MNPEDIGDLFHAQTSEIPQLYHLGFAAIETRQFFEGFIKREEFIRARFGYKRAFSEVDPDGAAASFRGVAGARMVDHDPAHELRRRGKEVAAILPGRTAVPRKLKIRIVQQSRGLQGVVWPLATHVMPGETFQLRLHEGKEFFQGARIPLAPLAEELRHLGRRRCGCGHSAGFRAYQIAVRESITFSLPDGGSGQVISALASMAYLDLAENIFRPRARRIFLLGALTVTAALILSGCETPAPANQKGTAQRASYTSGPHQTGTNL